MRMRDLERLTGVGRETIRFYIREGLLPEPERASRNSAFYSDDHVHRIRAIKRLQEERFLPLSVIRSLLDAGDGERWLASDAFPHIDALLRARMDAGLEGDVPLATLQAQLDCSDEEVAHALGAGVVRQNPDGSLPARDAAILRILMQLRDIGFTRERGFLSDGMKIYSEVIEYIANHDVDLFFDHMAGEVGEAEAAALAERGISLMNDVLSLMRTREILRLLASRRTIANDNA